MPDYHGTRLGRWGQLYHWVKQDNGKLKFVNGLEPVDGVEFSNDPRVWHEPTKNLLLEHQGGEFSDGRLD